MSNLAAVRKRAHEEAAGTRWCILRTSPGATISLADTLAGEGFDVWTPIEVITKRAVTRGRPRVDTLSPIMPSFVFAAEAEAADLLRLSANSRRQHADFSVFHYRDRIPLIRDEDLDKLREAEEDAAARRVKQLRRDRRKAEPFAEGEEIKISGGAFGGLPGRIEESDERFTLVCFGNLCIKMDTFLLRTDIL